MTDKVQMISIDKITWDTRYRKDLGNINELAESIKEKGILQPITVNQDLVLLAGERRLTAAKQAGLTKIPALIRDQSKMEDATIDLREVELIENVFRKDFTWVEHANLIAEIDKLCREKNVDWSVRKTAQLIGHSHPMNVSRSLHLAEAVNEMPELAACRTQDDALKFLKKIEEGAVVAELRRRQEKSRNSGLVDALTLAKGNYKIGDAFAEMAKLPNGAGVVSLIEVDPPYGIDLPSVKKGGSATTYKEVDTNAYGDFLKKVATETYRIASDHCWMIFWYGPTHHQLVLTSLREAGWEVDDIPAIWNKDYGQTLAPDIYLARCYEPFFVCRKGSIDMHKRGRSNVFNFKPIAGVKKYHPTERPVEMIEDIIETFVGLCPRVFIPFLGSGATLRAVYNLGGTGWGYDIDPQYRDKFLLSVQEDVEALDRDDNGGVDEELDI